jgi:RNA polymerase sigma-70 factor (ECF subfamily)
MKSDTPPIHLSLVSTSWSLLRQAHAAPQPGALAAQERLLERYRGAIYRYLLAILRDPHLADDLTQEFSLKLLRGEFRRAAPERGRFRDYVKTVLINLVNAHRRKASRVRTALQQDMVETTSAPAVDLPFEDHWRAELLERAWQSLRAAHPDQYAVLRFRAQRPELPSPVQALYLSRQLGKPLTSGGVRQALRRARQHFAQLLMGEVAETLNEPTRAELEDELRALNLWEYCRDFATG